MAEPLIVLYATDTLSTDTMTISGKDLICAVEIDVWLSETFHWIANEFFIAAKSISSIVRDVKDGGYKLDKWYKWNANQVQWKSIIHSLMECVNVAGAERTLESNAQCPWITVNVKRIVYL